MPEKKFNLSEINWQRMISWIAHAEKLIIQTVIFLLFLVTLFRMIFVEIAGWLR
jgi:hypothetical protein